jgi:predicted CXXCH cytochrome family protein
MQIAAPDTVLGRFQDSPATNDGAPGFVQRGARYFIRARGPDGRMGEFEAKYAFGLYPLQQYLAPLEGGRLQAYGLAWDARPAEEGGQRWFDLYADRQLEPGDPLHWTGVEQNWNYQCADCHSTNVRKNYDAATDAFSTSWSEISVGCEACHGPASNHLAWARRDAGWRALQERKGLVNALDERKQVSWRPQVAGTASRSTPRATAREIETCARCHARRGQYTDDIHAGQNWLDAFRPALLTPGLYYADGQQRDEVYTWGSFVQSRMYAAGVTCADCHEPHSGKLRASGNAVCAQCHAPAKFDAPDHHHHAPGSAGAQCVACHMPARTYMQVDPRRDHSFRIPRPDLSDALGTPNACSACHQDQPASWAAAALNKRRPRSKPGHLTFAASFAAAERGEPQAAAELATLIEDPAQPALVRASALARLAPLLTPRAMTTVAHALNDADALVRASAAEVFTAIDPALRVEYLSPLLRDPVRLVRMTAARALAGEPEARLRVEDREAFAAALEEWRAGERFNADRPEAHANLGALALQRGSVLEAKAAFERALELDPTFAPAAVNLAEAHRVSGDESGAERVLREALVRQPSEAAVHHALGLSLVRQRRLMDGVAALGKAHELAPANVRFAYVYAVALLDTGQREAALAVLHAALREHPHDPALKQALASFR